MKRTYLITILIIFLTTGLNAAGVSVFTRKGESTAENKDGFSQLYGVSVGLLPVGIKHPGLGVSYDFERYLGNNISVDANANAAGFFAHWFSFADPVIDLSAGFNLRGYPFYEALRGIYGGFGAGCDAVFYLGQNGVPSDAQKLFFYIKPEIGWKYYILDHFMLDFTIDYKKRFITTPNNLPKFYYDALSEGFHIGLAFKFFWGK